MHSNENKYCCLGVLCDLAVKSKVIGKPRLNCFDEYIYAGKIGVLPEKVRIWAGLRTRDGQFETPNKDCELLTELNDDGKKFKTIANVIESKPKGLFV